MATKLEVRLLSNNNKKCTSRSLLLTSSWVLTTYLPVLLVPTIPLSLTILQWRKFQKTLIYLTLRSDYTIQEPPTSRAVVIVIKFRVHIFPFWTIIRLLYYQMYIYVYLVSSGISNALHLANSQFPRENL